MISRSAEKLIRKLRAKKHRQQHQLFVAEGRKVIADILKEGLHPIHWFALADSIWIAQGAEEIDPKQLQELSSLEVADEVLAVFSMPIKSNYTEGSALVLNELKDPGNLGTIMRTADWFGIKTIYCSLGTVDVFNPKVVQSTMGSIARIQIQYLEDALIYEKLSAKDIFVADMNGVPVKEIKPAGDFALIMGNESHGPSNFWKEKAKAVTIPQAGKSEIESLNVAMATAVILGCWT